MILPSDQERLLTDVLAEEAGTGFPGALLGETLRLARRRRQIRRVRRWGGALLTVALFATVAIWRTPRPPIAPPSPSQNYELTLSQPLPATCIIQTHPFAPDQLVVSSAAVGIIRTLTNSALYRELTDDELLALAPGPAALVRRGPREAELVFVTHPAPAGTAQQN